MTSHHRSRRGRNVRVDLLATCVLVMSLIGVAASQSPVDDRAWYERFVDGIAGLIYGFAWPTATYERVSFDTVERAAGGADVVFRLHGKSAFADGDLWVQVRLQVRSGEITGMQWGRHNGFFPPGFTSSVTIAALNDALSRAGKPTTAPSGRPASTVIAVACFDNSTTTAINYRLQRGRHSQNFTLDPGKTMTNWADVSDRRFIVSFDDSLAQGVSMKSLEFSAGTRSGEPTQCEEDFTFDFLVSDQRIGIFPRRWLPGFAHPFNPGMVSTATKDKWACAAGFRPYPWPSDTGLSCLGENEGVVGVRLTREANAPFLRVVFVAAGSPAARAGLAVGQSVISIDGFSTDGMDVNSAIGKIRGPVGTQLRLGVAASGNEPTVLVVVRQ